MKPLIMELLVRDLNVRLLLRIRGQKVGIMSTICQNDAMHRSSAESVDDRIINNESHVVKQNMYYCSLLKAKFL